jgi:hypothetical protein
VPLPCPLQQQQQQQPGAAAEQYCSSSHLSPGVEKSSSSSSGTGACLVAAGSYPVVDVLQGTAPAQLELSIHLLAPVTTPAPATDLTCKRSDSDISNTAGAVAGTAAAAAAAAAAAGPEVVGVRHVIDVTLVSASGLPDAADLGAAGQQVPDSRFIKYCFPGEQVVTLLYLCKPSSVAGQLQVVMHPPVVQSVQQGSCTCPALAASSCCVTLAGHSLLLLGSGEGPLWRCVYCLCKSRC